MGFLLLRAGLFAFFYRTRFVIRLAEFDKSLLKNSKLFFYCIAHI